MLAVGLVHGDQIGQLENTLLDALQLVTRTRESEKSEAVHHVRHGHLGLPNTDCLDENHIEACGLEQHDGLARCPSDAAECARCRRRPDVGVLLDRQPGHAGLVSQYRPACAGRRRIDGEHRNPMPTLDQVHAQGVDEC